VDVEYFCDISSSLLRNETRSPTRDIVLPNSRRSSESKETKEEGIRKRIASRSNRGLNRVECHFPRRIFRVRCREKLLNEVAVARHRLKGR